MGRFAATARRHLRLLTVLGVLFVAFVVFVLVWFQPQKLFIDDTVNEALPVSRTVVTPDSVVDKTGTPTVLASGLLHSGEHHTEGTARVLRLEDGRRFLRLTDFRTSNGPVVKVWLSAASSHSSDGAINDAAHLDLGGLKGNIGNQNYALPADVDLGSYRSVVIWCDRFNVSFGAAPLVAT